MNPACMKNTRNAVTSTHTVLIGLTKSLAWCCTDRRSPRPPAELRYQFDRLHRTEEQNDRRHLAGEDDADEFPGFLVLESLESCEHVRNIGRHSISRLYAEL